MSEPIPSAIARGPDAETPGSISPVRMGIGAGVLAMVFVLVTFVVRPVPDRALSIVGGDPSEFGRAGGMRLVWVPPANADAAQIERAFMARHHGRVSRSGDAFVVEVGGVPPEEVDYAAHLLSSGGLTFHRSVITEAMPELGNKYGIPFVDIDNPGGRPPVALDVDQWQPEDGGARQTDYYLLGDTREAIEAALDGARRAGWALPEGTHVAYQYVEPWSKEVQRPFWRSYVIETKPAIGGEHIAEATSSYDPNTNRPIVLLDFDREGARIFGDLTSSMVGQKLATVLGGTVMSAPIINGPIRGGRASITMGGAEVTKQERERDALVGVLKSGQLPAGGTLREATYTAPSVTAVQEWLARGVLALGVAFLVGLLAWALVRATHPVWRTPETRLPGRIAWERFGVLLLVPAVLYVGSNVTAPGIDPDQLLFALGDESQFSLTMLGVGPLLTSFVLVELVATIVPAWRRRRHANRLPFDIAAVVLACVISIVQSYFAVSYLDALDASPIGLDRLLFLTSIVVVTLVYAGLAALVRRYGFGSGLVAVIATSEAMVLVHYFAADSTSDVVIANPKVVVFGGIVTYAIVMIVALRLRIARAGEVPLRVPTSGEAPIYGATGLLTFFIGVASLVGASSVPLWMNDAYAWSLGASVWFVLVALVMFTLLWSWAFARPRVLRPFAERAGLAAPSGQSWRVATLLSAGVLLALLAGHWVIYERAGTMEGVARVMLLAAVALDVFDDLRGRRGKTKRAWSLQSGQHADIAGHALATAGIAYHLTGANVRSLLAWFGPYAPVDVYVRTEDAARARELLANVFAAK
jgi:hypothetical protein